MTFEFSPIHVIGVGAGLALLYKSILLVRQRKEGIFEFLLWAGFGVALLAISVGSALSTVNVLGALVGALGALGLNVGLASISFLANLALLFVVFYTYVQLVESRRQLSDLAQEVALLRYEFDQRLDDRDD